MNDEILAVRFYRNHVITIAREEDQQEEVSFTPCESMEDALDTLQAKSEELGIENDYPTLQSYAAPLASQRHLPTENKIVSAEGFSFGLSVTRG